MNKVIISGNIVRDPEIGYTSGENSNARTRFSIACQRRFKNAEGVYEADFPSVVAWGKTAEFVNKFFHKGDRIEVVGELRTGSYTNKDGVKVYTTDVWATEVGFGGSKNSGSSETPSTNNVSSKSVMPTPQYEEEGDMPWDV